LARSSAQKNYFNFVAGLNTETSPLASPDNTSRAGDNFDLRRDGSLIRRRGVDAEKDATQAWVSLPSGLTNYTSAHEWRSVGGDGSLNKLLVQYDKYLILLNLDQAATLPATFPNFDASLVGGIFLNNAFDMSILETTASGNGAAEKVQVTFGKGAAFVVGPNISPFYIEYNSTTNTYIIGYIGGSASNIQVRDLSGVDDGLALDNRPAYASYAALTAGNPNHAYNLLNQGWSSTQTTTYITASSKAPSNSDMWWHGKNSTGVFTPAEMDKIWFGSIQAPKGHYLYNAFNINRSANMVGVADVTTTARPSTVSFYNGRVWYSGIQSPEYSGTVLFSRLVTDPALDAHKCYMEADPTSEIVSDLVATDGGTITIPEAGKIVKLLPLANGLLVFARNGVWIIEGTSSTGGFAATAFSVKKITNVGTTSPEAVVEVEGTAIYLARAGIYSISVDPQTLVLSASNITQTTIQSKINAIDDAALDFVKSSYDPLEREVNWYYSETLDATYKDAANKIITLDIVLKAFYTSTIAGTIGTTGVPFITSPFTCLPITTTAPDYTTMMRMITLTPNGADNHIAVAVMYDDRLVDWYTSNNVGYSYISSMDTGFELHNDAMRDKQIDEVHFFFNRTEQTVTNGVLDNQSSCLFSYRFDWADSADSGLYTASEQAYYFPRMITIPNNVGTVAFTSGQEVVATKHNVNGNGRAFQLHIESEGTKDMHILGWATFISGVTR